MNKIGEYLDICIGLEDEYDFKFKNNKQRKIIIDKWSRYETTSEHKYNTQMEKLILNKAHFLE